jgi:hypothetical protein
VYKAVDLDDPSRPPVAMKKVRRDARRGYSVTVMREIALLQRLKHENVVELLEVCSYAHDGLFLVMTCMEIDLLSLYYSKVNGRRCVAEPNSKWFMRQLLRALAYCHDNNVVHRDVKCLARDTAVLMHDGAVKLVQDVRVGDLLLGDDSTPRQCSLLRTAAPQWRALAASRRPPSFECNLAHVLSLKARRLSAPLQCRQRGRVCRGGARRRRHCRSLARRAQADEAVRGRRACAAARQARQAASRAASSSQRRRVCRGWPTRRLTLLCATCSTRRRCHCACAGRLRGFTAGVVSFAPRGDAPPLEAAYALGVSLLRALRRR